MIPVILKNEAFTLDESTISSGYLSEKDLMDNAGKSIAQFVVENIHDPFNQNIIVLAGPGNNGRDAIILSLLFIVLWNKFKINFVR